MAERFYPLFLRDPVTNEEIEVAALPSVTTVENMRNRGEGMTVWAWKIGKDGKDLREEQQKNMDRGSNLHDCVPDLIAFGAMHFPLENYPEEQRGWISALLSWWRVYQPRCIQAEFPICSLKYLYAGRVDFYGTIVRTHSVIDFKTVDNSDKFKKYPTGYISHKAQLVAYANAMREMGRRVDDLILLRLAPDGKYHCHHIPQVEWDGLFQSFLRMRTEFDYHKNGRA